MSKMANKNGHCPGGPGLAGTRMSPFWILLELMVIDVGGGNNWSYSQNVTNNKPRPSFYRSDAFLSPNQQCQIICISM